MTSAAEKRVRRWADATEEPNAKYRDAHVWYDSDKKDNFTAYKLLIADVVDGKLRAVPRGVMAAAAVMQGRDTPFGRAAQPDEIAPSYVFFAAAIFRPTNTVARCSHPSG